MNYTSLTFISISLDQRELLKTIASIQEYLNLGAKLIIVSKYEIDLIDSDQSSIEAIIGEDSSLYNALNIGLNRVNTDYCMMLHAGDVIIKGENFDSALRYLINKNLDLVLGGAIIGRRRHLSSRWTPKLFRFYVQPPHLPILYRHNFLRDLRFREDIFIVSDFYFLKELFKLNPKYYHSNLVYVKMATGGKTTSSFRSWISVTREFYLSDGVIAIVLAPVRLLLKLLLR